LLFSWVASACERNDMIILTALVTLLLFIYLLVALLRPEWF
jgi:K+-transporting ATPase KdpF subunit